MSDNGARFWVKLYTKKNNPHMERTNFIQKTFNNFYINELNKTYHYGIGGFMFNDCDNLHKYSKNSSSSNIKIIFPYAVNLYPDFCDYYHAFL